MKKKIIIGIVIIALLIGVGVAVRYQLLAENIESAEINKEEIIKTIYSEYLNDVYEVEWKIDSIEIVELEDAKNLYPEATRNAIYAMVQYSVNDIYDMAGNGRIEGEWVVDKSVCIYADKINGTYQIISVGTGW